MSTQFRSERGLYVVEECEYFAVLWYHPVAMSTLYDGAKMAEAQRIVTLHKGPGTVYDALQVAKWHAHSQGDTAPRLEDRS